MVEHLRAVTNPALIPQKSLPRKAPDQHNNLVTALNTRAAKTGSLQLIPPPLTVGPLCTDDNIARGLLKNLSSSSKELNPNALSRGSF